ncbi:MAG: hypothetical protein ACJA0Q_002194, partial [Saprospiraceae bacterium]
MLKSKELTSNVNASTRCRESLPIVLIALFL